MNLLVLSLPFSLHSLSLLRSISLLHSPFLTFLLHLPPPLLRPPPNLNDPRPYLLPLRQLPCRLEDVRQVPEAQGRKRVAGVNYGGYGGIVGGRAAEGSDAGRAVAEDLEVRERVLPLRAWE